MTDPIPTGWVLCDRCAGSGRITTVLWTLPCPTCEGTGLVVKKEKS